MRKSPKLVRKNVDLRIFILNGARMLSPADFTQREQSMLFVLNKFTYRSDGFLVNAVDEVTSKGDEILKGLLH